MARKGIFLKGLIVTLGSLELLGCASSNSKTYNADLSIKIEETQPFVDLSKRRADLQILSEDDRRKICSDRTLNKKWYHWAAPEVEVSGKIDRARVNVSWYYNSLNQAIESYLFGEPDALDIIKDGLQKSAQEKSFEKVRPYTGGPPGYNPYNEPLFHQSLLLLSLGIIFPELELRYGKENPDIVAIKNWGDRIFENSNSGRDDFIGKARGVDRAAGKAAAYSVWGTSARNIGALYSGYQYFLEATTSIGSGGVDRVWSHKGYQRLHYSNSTYGGLVIAAEALYKAGLITAYDLPAERRSIHDAVSWLINGMAKESYSHIYSQSHTGSVSIAWAEYYAARFPEREISQVIYKTPALRNATSGVYGGFFGGNTTCLVRPIVGNP